VAPIVAASTFLVKRGRGIYPNAPQVEVGEQGPEFVKIERSVRYTRRALDEWIKSGKK